MAGNPQTIKVTRKEDGEEMVINESDFDRDVHDLPTRGKKKSTDTDTDEVKKAGKAGKAGKDGEGGETK